MNYIQTKAYIFFFPIQQNKSIQTQLIQEIFTLA